MIATVAIIALLIVLAVAIAVVKSLFFDDHDEPNYYAPKKEIEDNREEIEKLNKEIEVIKDEKSDNATDCSNSLNSMDI